MTGSDLHLTYRPFAEAREHVGGFWITAGTDLHAARDREKRVADEPPGQIQVL